MRAPVNRASSFFSFLMSKLIKLILLLICCPSLSVWHGGISPLVNLFLLKSTLTRSDQFLLICFLTCWHLQRDTSASETKNKKVENALSSFCLSSLQLLKSDEVSIMFSFLFFTFFFFFFFAVKVTQLYFMSYQQSSSKSLHAVTSFCSIPGVWLENVMNSLLFVGVICCQFVVQRLFCLLHSCKELSGKLRIPAFSALGWEVG